MQTRFGEVEGGWSAVERFRFAFELACGSAQRRAGREFVMDRAAGEGDGDGDGDGNGDLDQSFRLWGSLPSQVDMLDVSFMTGDEEES